MAEIKSESVADFIPESVADFARNTQIDEISSRRQRIEQLTRLDLIGQAVTKAVGEIRFILQYTTAPISPR